MDSNAFNDMGSSIVTSLVILVVVSMAAGAVLLKACSWLIEHVSVSIH